MKDKMRLLAQLQECDNKILEILKRKEKGPQRIQELHDQLKASELKLQEQSSQLEASKKERRQFEKEIQDLDGKAEKSQAKLFNIKSNKEYAAVLKEIEDLKKLKFDTEEKVIQIMEETEVLEKGLAAQKQGIQEMKTRIEKEKREIEKELSVLEQELKVFEKKRGEVAASLDQDLLKKYLLLRERKGGLAVSAVLGGVCQTCHMGIPPQKFNELIRGDAIMSCPHCHRLIYWGDDKDFQASETVL